MPTNQGSIRLFQFAGIQVFLHWSWFLVAMYQVNVRGGAYTSFVWIVIEYIMLFAIVTMHEFGHALACRQVGGSANRIVLWPLGGVAYVDPPPRPGAHLWSIAAGPLVNLALLPVFGILTLVGYAIGLAEIAPDLYALLWAGIAINLGLFVFNMLPIYPLDGGQILRSLLWFVLGPARSLMAATAIGFVGVAGLGLLAFAGGSIWIGILAAFAGLQCVAGFAYAHMLKRLAGAQRRKEFACPSCKKAAAKGAFWFCGACKRPYDAFESHRWATASFGQSSSLGLNLQDSPAPTMQDRAKCPGCGALASDLRCPDCGLTNKYEGWKLASTEERLPLSE
jgi:Zn-dependent protease